jgi:translation initiation factor IF-2
MADKKTKIYNLSKELNLSSDTILDFLKKKGFEVKNHMSPATDEMVSALNSHFKKEKDVAERHHRKLTELRTTKRRDAEESAEESGEAKSKRKTPSKQDEAPPAIVEEPKAIKMPEVELPSVPPGSVAEESLPPSSPKEEDQKPTELLEPVAEPTVLKVEKKKLTPLEAAMARPQRGLTIKGMIEIRKSAQVGPTAESDDKKKKKKKKIKEGKSKVDLAAIEAEERKDKKKKKGRRAEVSVEDVNRAIRETLTETPDAAVVARAAVKKKKKEKREEEEQKKIEEIALAKTRLRVTEFVTVGDLANLMRVPVADVIGKIMGLGMMVSINQRLDKDTITVVADEFGLQVDFEDQFTADALHDELDDPAKLVPRPPVVTIMGHVDHGKTSLLDHIRNANVVAGESGGITQHIGAYEVTLPNGKQITFLDTPGHEAFTAMRARGAKVTDIVILVVAAEDNVMPQTVEAISHAQAAGVPIVVAINKIDKAEANPERIKQQLSERGLLVEDYGGKYQVVGVSARTGKNVDLLLEKILLEADVLDLKADPARHARGTVVEAELDKGKGIVATVLVQRGSLHIGDSFVCGVWSGRVRAMFDERGKRVEMVGPSAPVQITGFDGIPQAGDELVVLADERQTREISFQRQQLKREQDFRQTRRLTLDDISKQIKEGQVRDLPIIVKADVDGSAEALSDSLMKLSTSEVKVQVIHKGVGGISESDVLLAAASQAIIIGFHVRPNLKARQLSQQESIDIRLYSIIYDAINDVKSALEGLLAPKVTEEITSTVEVRNVFKISKIGTVAGCFVREGKIQRNNHVRLVRDGVEVFNGTLASLKRFKDDVREVEQGFECGLGLENFNDVKVGDIVEAFKSVEVKRTLD